MSDDNPAGLSDATPEVLHEQFPGLEIEPDPLPEGPSPQERVDELLRTETAPAAAATAPWLPITLIGLAIVGLGTVGYFAWQRGMLGGDSGASPVKVVEAPAADGATVVVEGDPLDKLNDDIAGLRPYRHYATALRSMDGELDSTKIETSSPGVLSEATKQRLYELQPLGLAFAKEYEAFEARAARDAAPKLQSYQELVRSAFLERMGRFIEKVGEAYAAEQGISNPVFTTSDTFIGAVEKHGRADAGPLREKWLSAVHSQEQSKLNVHYTAQIEELQTRIDALKALHQEVNAVLAAAPEYHIRGGIIGSTARELLDVYDSLAGRVEGMVVDFEQYVETLPADHNSDRLDAQIKEFNELAREDHFYAFRETYKIYEQDRELEHPAYPKLKEHLAFAETHWPTAVGNYKQTYTSSESLWERNWAK